MNELTHCDIAKRTNTPPFQGRGKGVAVDIEGHQNTLIGTSSGPTFREFLA